MFEMTSQVLEKMFFNVKVINTRVIILTYRWNVSYPYLLGSSNRRRKAEGFGYWSGVAKALTGRLDCR